MEPNLKSVFDVYREGEKMAAQGVEGFGRGSRHVSRCSQSAMYSMAH